METNEHHLFLNFSMYCHAEKVCLESISIGSKLLLFHAIHNAHICYLKSLTDLRLRKGHEPLIFMHFSEKIVKH